MLTTSTEINDIAAALAKAQGAMDNAAKDRTNPAYKSRYADLASVREATSGPLSANGIAVLQAAATTADGVTVETRFVHTSGQWFACTVGAVPKSYDPQSIGSCITYLRRYALMSMAGVASDDDDGNLASGRGDHPPARSEAPPWPRRDLSAPVQKWSDNERKAFCAKLGELGHDYDVVAGWCESVSRPRPSLMSIEQRAQLIAALATPAVAAKVAAFYQEK